ncbi:MAG: serine/threonine protein kinase, partial [Planctomycetales bacterium]
MVTTASCPSKEELFRLNHGDLPGEQLESVCDHVETCEKCQLILGQLDDPPDEFAKQLAQITPEALENARVAIEAETLKEKPTLTVPCQLGQYEVLRLIAHGGMGEVYEGRHVRLKRPVAVKLIRGFRQDDPVSHEHFLREMETAGQLEHPNLVRAYDAWEHDGYLFLAQELLDGDSLQTLAHNGQIKTPDEIVAALLGTCRALDQLHGKGFVHRDVKPANIMRLTDGTIKVIDYGLAVAADSRKSAGRVGAGTVGYMSPEQANGSVTVDNRSDIFSAGRVLKYLLSKLPEAFAEAKQSELVQELTALAERLTQREPKDRLQSVYAVIVQLEQLQQSVVPIETPPEMEAPPKVPPTPPAKRTRKTKNATSRKRTATAAPPPEPKINPQRRGVGWWALFALILAAVAFTAYQIVFKTDRQTTVLVENHQPGDVIKITSEDGKVRSVELGDQPKFVVDRGTYELTLEGPDNRRLNPANITVTGRDQLTVRIEDRPEPIVETPSVGKSSDQADLPTQQSLH